jgi:hypothetical protein
MRSRAAFILLCVFPTALWSTMASARPPQSPSLFVAVYDENPSHIWNRLYAALWVREDSQGKRYGEDSLDPMLWSESKHLLSQPSHDAALRVLDEFLRTDAENLIKDPVKRAMLQRDLWAVFDWSVQQHSGVGQPEYGDEKRELQNRVAELLRRLALTQEQIRALPDNYAQAVNSGVFPAEYDPAHPQRPFLPPDLFDPRGPWVCITPNPDTMAEGVVAKAHVSNFSGRSVFLVFMRLPEGRKATLGYFRTLWNFPQAWVAGPADGGPLEPNPDLPSFPGGAQVALVRQMMLFDTQGNLVVSPITESVQIRMYREITAARARSFKGGLTTMARNSGQDFFEIRISRPLLFSGKQGGLRATGRDEIEPPTFQTMGFDMLGESDGPEQIGPHFAPIMQRCLTCHSGGGIRSFNSVDSLLKPARPQTDPQDVNYGPRYWNESAALWWKQSQYDWGLLNGYWKASPNWPLKRK